MERRLSLLGPKYMTRFDIFYRNSLQRGGFLAPAGGYPVTPAGVL